MAIEIGKVSVRVLPDTKGFAAKTKKDLKALKDPAFKVNAELNADRFKAQVKDLIASTNRDLLNPKNRIKFRASLEASNSQIREEVRDIRDRMTDQAAEEKVEFEAGISQTSQRKNGSGGLLGIDVQDVLRDLSRELGRNSFPVKIDAHSNRVSRDLKRSLRSEKFDIDVDMKVDRTEALDEVESFRKVVENTAHQLRNMEGLKLAVDVDQASIKKWKAELDTLQSMGRVNDKTYTALQKTYKNLDKQAKDYHQSVIDSQAAIDKANKEYISDLQREEKLSSELADIREVIAKASEVRTTDLAREKRLIGQIESIRREAFEKSAQRSEAQEKHAEKIVDAEAAILRIKKEQTKVQGQTISYEDKALSSETIRDDLQEKLDRAHERLQVDSIQLDVALDQVSVEAVAARLQALARDRMSTIWVNMKKANLAHISRNWSRIADTSGQAATNVAKYMSQITGLRLLWRTSKQFVEILPKLDMMIPGLAKSLSALTLGISGAVGGLGLMFTGLSDAAGVFKLILGLPSGIAGLAGSALILGRAFADFKEVLPEVVDYYKQLGEVVSDSVWSKAKKPMQELQDVAAGFLDTYAPEWAKSWGESLGAFADGIKGAAGSGSLEEFLVNSIHGTDNAESGWNSLGDAIMRLVGIGSRVFPDLGTWFSDTMADFDSWVQENDANGNMERWIREGGDALRQLGSIGVSTVKIFGGIADAFSAAGWPGLEEMAKGMERIGTAALGLKDDDMFMQPLEQLRGFFEEMEKLGPKFGHTMETVWSMVGHSAESLKGPISSVLESIMYGFNSSKFQSGFGTFISGFGSFLEDIAPGLEDFVAELGTLLGAVGTAAEAWGPGFNELLELFASAGDKLHPGLTSFLESTGPVLEDLVKNLTPHIEDFATAVSDLLGNENFQEFVGDMVGSLGTLLGVIIDVGTWIADMAGKFSDWYASLGEGGQTIVRWTAILAAFGLGVGTLAGKLILGVAKWLKPFRMFLGWFKKTKLGKVVGKWLGKAGTAIGNFFKGIGGWFKKIPTAIWSKLSGWLGKGKGVLLKFGSWLKGWAPNLRGLWSSVTSAFKAGAGKLKALPGIIGKALKGLGGKIGGFLKGAFKGLKGAKFLAPIGRFFKGVPGKLAKILPKGGLVKLIRPVLGRFLGILGGPAGWALLIASLINPVGIADFVDSVVDALGFGDSWLGRFTETFKTSLRENLGEGNLLDLVLEGFKEAWLDFKQGDIVEGVAGLFAGNTLDLLTAVIEGAFEALGLGETLDSFEALQEKYPEYLGEGGVRGFFSNFWTGLRNTLSDSWDALVEKIKSWKPVAVVIEFFKNPWKKIKGWLFGEDGGEGAESSISAPPASAMSADLDFSKDFGSKITDALQTAWDKLVAWVKKWNPFSVAFRLGQWVGKKIKEWLGIGEDGLSTSGVSFSFDFSSLWENKIKPALKTGLLALAGLIAAPGLLLIAPLAVPALIIGWLLGRDGEGGWSFSALTSKIKGAWGKIKSAITTGVTAIMGFIGTLVFTPIAVGKKLAEWILGSDFAQNAKTAVQGVIEGASSTIKSGVDTGIATVREHVNGGGGAGAAGKGIGSAVSRILGLTPAGKSEVKESFKTVNGYVYTFGADTRSAYDTTEKSAGTSLGKLVSGTAKKFSEMAVGATGESESMKDGVTGDVSSMSSQAAAKAAALQSKVVSAMTRANVRGVLQAVKMNRAYVAQMRQMVVASLAQAGVLRGSLPGRLSVNTGGSGRFTGNTFVSGLSGALHRAAGVARSIAGSIRNVLSFSAYSSGRSIGSTFASGLRSKVSSAISAAGSLAAAVRRRLPNSPADEGPFSGSGWGGWGESIGEELAKGLRNAAPEVAREAEKLMSGVQGAIDRRSEQSVGVDFERTRRRYGLASDGEAVGSSGQTINVNVESNSDDPLQDGRRLGGDLAFALNGAGI